MGLFLGSLFCSIDQHLYFCVSTTLFGLLALQHFLKPGGREGIMSPALFFLLSIILAILGLLCCYSVTKSCLTLWPHELQPTRLPYPSLSLTACSNSCPSSRWCHPTISSFVVPFSSCSQSFPASGSFPVSQLFLSGGWSIRASASASVLLMNILGWFPLRLTGLILKPKGLSSIFSNTTIQKPQFFGISLLYRPIFTSVRDYWKNHSFDYKFPYNF